MSGEDSRTGERWAEKTAEHSKGEREKKRPEKSGEKKEMFRLKWTSKRTVSVFCFFCKDKFSLDCLCYLQ